MISEEMTIDELLEWANGLGICTFKKQMRFDQDEVVCEKRDVCIRLSFMRYHESVPKHGGMRAVSCHFEDNRNGGMSGGGGGRDDLQDVAKFIELYAAKLDLADEQMSIFSLL